MIGVYFRPEKTSLITGWQKKDKLKVDGLYDTDSFWNYLKSGVSEPIADFFKDVSKSEKSDEIYVVLPDFAFLGFNTFNYSVISEAMEKRDKKSLSDTLLDVPAIRNAFNIVADDVSFSMPIEFSIGKSFHKVSIYAIEKRFIETLENAASMAGVVICSVEAASVAYMRCIDKWNEEAFIVDVSEDKTSIISFLSNFGLVSEFIPSVTTGSLKSDNINDEVIHHIVVSHDFAASKMCDGLMNENISFTFLSHEKEFSKFNDFLGRINDIDFNDIIRDKVELSKDTKFSEVSDIVLTGTLFQACEDINVFSSSSSYMTFHSFDVLPDDMRKEGKLHQVQKKLKKFLRIVCALLGVSVLVLMIGAGFFSTVSVPKSLTDDYNNAQNDSSSLDASISLLKTASKEHQKPVEAIEGLVKLKPNGLNFTSLDIGKSKDYWFILNAVSQDPLMFRDFADSLNNDPLFSNVGVNSISSESSTVYKKGIIRASRGEDAE